MFPIEMIQAMNASKSRTWQVEEVSDGLSLDWFVVHRASPGALDSRSLHVVDERGDAETKALAEQVAQVLNLYLAGSEPDRVMEVSGE